MTQTPEFLLWAVQWRCALRALQDGSDPERTERQLRAARAASDAQREGRVFEGFAVDPPDGFRVADALAIYGGEETARRLCGQCPANVLTRGDDPLPLAGCYGLVRLPDDPLSVHLAIEQGIASAFGSVRWEQLCHATTPRWYGLWIDPMLDRERLLVRERALAAATIDDAVCRQGISELLVAMQAATSNALQLHVRLYPPGRVEGDTWRLVPHCPRCKGAWTAGKTQCPVCGYVGHPAPDKKRRARGRRPYFPLSRLLGRDEQAARFMARYDAFRAHERHGDQPPIPPPPAPQDSRGAHSDS